MIVFSLTYQFSNGYSLSIIINMPETLLTLKAKLPKIVRTEVDEDSALACLRKMSFVIEIIEVKFFVLDKQILTAASRSLRS